MAVRLPRPGISPDIPREFGSDLRGTFALKRVQYWFVMASRSHCLGVNNKESVASLFGLVSPFGFHQGGSPLMSCSRGDEIIRLPKTVCESLFHSGLRLRENWRREMRAGWGGPLG